MPAKNIFICYRRDDAEGYAGRIADRLNVRFPRRVFRDVEGISPGADFTRVIQDTVGRSHVLIAIIGKDWLTITDDAKRRRLDLADDFVRNEIATALNRNITVIPVLVRGAKMPSREQLPPDLAPLSRRNALEVTETDFDHDVQRLVAALEYALGEQRQVLPPPTSNTGSHTCLIVGIVGAVVAVIVCFVIILGLISSAPQSDTTPVTDYSSPAPPGQSSMPTQAPPPATVAFEPIGNWTIQIQNGGQGRLNIYPGGTYETDFSESGTWNYYGRRLTLDGWFVIYIESWNGQQYEGSVTGPEGSIKVWLTPQ
jgi:hypothetical protein